MVGEYIRDPREYGGEIYKNDFDKKFYMSDIAARIAATDDFNKRNKKIVENKLYYESLKETE